MNNLKLIYTGYGEVQINCKTIDELQVHEKRNLAKLLVDTLSIEQKVQLLEDLKIERTQEMIEHLSSIGYAPIITRIEKIPELTIPNPNQLYYQENGRWVQTFNITKKDFDYNNAISAEAPLFVHVKIENSHPFRQAQIRFQKKQDEIKQDRAVKRRQKQIEKAKKLLEENKLIGK